MCQCISHLWNLGCEVCQIRQDNLQWYSQVFFGSFMIHKMTVEVQHTQQRWHHNQLKLNCTWPTCKRSMLGWDGIVVYLTSHEAYCLWVGYHFQVIIYTHEDEVIWRWRASPTGIRTQYCPVKGATCLDQGSHCKMTDSSTYHVLYLCFKFEFGIRVEHVSQLWKGVDLFCTLLKQFAVTVVVGYIGLIFEIRQE